MQQPNVLQNIMKQLNTGGWDALNNIGESPQLQLAKQMEDAQREARIVMECFGTAAGQQCLEWLIKKTLLRGPNAEQQGAVTAEHFAIASAKREGQNNVVFMILQALNFKEDAK